MARKKDKITAKSQQGDVVLKRITSLPNGMKEVKASSRGFVLAEGEVTGHYHTIQEKESIKMYEKDGKFYLSIGEATEVKHLKGPNTQADHNPAFVSPGSYEVRIVREYDAFDEEVRQVRD